VAVVELVGDAELGADHMHGVGGVAGPSIGSESHSTARSLRAAWISSRSSSDRSVNRFYRFSQWLVASWSVVAEELSATRSRTLCTHHSTGFARALVGQMPPPCAQRVSKPQQGAP